MCVKISSRKDILGCAGWKASWLFALCFLFIFNCGSWERSQLPWPRSRMLCHWEHSVTKNILIISSAACSVLQWAWLQSSAHFFQGLSVALVYDDKFMPGHCYGGLCWCDCTAPPSVRKHGSLIKRKLPEESCRPGRQSAKAGVSECFHQASRGYLSCNYQKDVPCLTLTLRVCTCHTLIEGKGQNCQQCSQPPSHRRMGKSLPVVFLYWWYAAFQAALAFGHQMES